MKKYFIISMLLVAAIRISACVNEAPTHNKYMFSVIHRNAMNDAFSERVNATWYDYTHGKSTDNDVDGLKYIKPNDFNTSDNVIIQYARHHGDREMLTYLRQLCSYIYACQRLSADTWDYPSKREQLQLHSRLLAVNQQARLYRGARLKDRYALLVMRSYFMLKNYNTCSIYWNSKASKLDPSVYKDMMKDIYAGTLVRSRHYEEACNIYASLNDMQSIKWCMRNQRNLAGIEKMYATNPNSPTLPYLVQDFVNNAQETIDDAGTEGMSDMMNEINVKPIYRNEVEQFIRFASSVVDEGKSNTPCLWQSASAFLNHLFGNFHEAETGISAAMNMKGTSRMKDNARAIRLLIAIQSAKPTTDFSHFLVTEMTWLEKKAKEDSKSEDILYDNHYTDVIDRIVYKNLVPKYTSWGQQNTALALIDMMSQKQNDNLTSENNSEWHWNYDYIGDYFDCIDTMQTQRLISHYAYLKSSHSDEFEQWIMSRLHISDDYFNDIIGTKLMRQCKFDEAAAYLEKVPVTYLDKQNIAPFMASRSYTVERWFKHQKMAEDYTTAEVRLTSNPKLRFCREMSQMESEYTYLSDANTRQAKAYELAVRYLQASYLGDCWYLTRYAQSCMDSCRVNETDYAAKAVNYLSLSKLSSDFSMKEKSIYALAYIPLDPWGGYFDDYEKKYNTENINTASRQYHSLIELALFTKSNDVDNYVSHCDVLNHFLKMANK